MLALLVAIPLLAGPLAWALARIHPGWARWTAAIAFAVDLALALVLWARHFAGEGVTTTGPWLEEWQVRWIPELGITLHLALDGFSLVLVILALAVGLAAVPVSWREIDRRVGFFHFHLLWVIAGIVGVFLALDLFLFYFFWELMLVPMYFLIALWGHERRAYASIKFFLFTQLGSLPMLVAIVALVAFHAGDTGTLTFDYEELLGTELASGTETLIMLGFLAAFVVKLPMVPFHTWLPDAHTEAPTAGSLILAGLLLKTGAYGLVRFVVPLFPEAALDWAPVWMALGVVGVIYGAVLAFSQTDLKRMVAYTSVAHMGLVLLGVFAWNELALQGVTVMIVAHAVSTGALFVIAGQLQERLHTRDIGRMGGLWERAPRMGGLTLLFALASLALPGLGDFVGEFLILLGAFEEMRAAAVVAALGVVTAAIYGLWLFGVAFQGPNARELRMPDLSPREAAILGVMAAAIVWIGVYPQPILDTTARAIENVQQIAAAPAAQVEGR